MYRILLIRVTEILSMEIQELNLTSIQKLSIGIKNLLEKFSYQDYLENNVTTSFLQTIISEDNISL